jgi:DNA-binding NtrC family response regulator
LLETGNRRLIGCRVLIAEDEYFLANDLDKALRAQGAEVIGPIAEVSEAIAQLGHDEFDVAVIDINLRDELAFSIADKLAPRHIPFVFATGYGSEKIPDRFQNIKIWQKPYDVASIVDHVARLYNSGGEEPQKRAP